VGRGASGSWREGYQLDFEFTLPVTRIPVRTASDVRRKPAAVWLVKGKVTPIRGKDAVHPSEAGGP
jgi:hypothetical protein